MDKIDKLIQLLHEETGLPFDRDAMNVDRMEEWGAVELRSESAGMWADGHLIDEKWMIEIYCVVDSRESWYIGQVNDALERFAEEVDDIGWRMPERGFLPEIDRVAWKWQAAIFGEMEIPEETETEEPEPNDPEEPETPEPENPDDPEEPKLDPDPDDPDPEEPEEPEPDDPETETDPEDEI